jgi:two-component system, CitB family, sensor kinase
LKGLPKHLEKSLFVSIIGNLVTNAFEAVEDQDEQERVVRLFILDNGEEILIEVEDSGTGLDPKMQSQIFQTRISTKKGSDRGYGLLKVSENIEALNGVVSIENGDLKGALFVLSIPKGGFLHG